MGAHTFMFNVVESTSINNTHCIFLKYTSLLSLSVIRVRVSFHLRYKIHIYHLLTSNRMEWNGIASNQNEYDVEDDEDYGAKK